jgi:CDP-diacylglycerol--serine O-phosphatidyltransferase
MAAWLVLVGFLMISKMPTPSLKSVRVPTDRAAYVVIVGIVLMVLVLRYPWAVMTAICAVYALVLAGAFVKAALHRA